MNAKRIFIVIGHDSPLDGTFRLDDLPGSGRIDEIARCISSALLVSNGIRTDTVILLVMQRERDTKVVEFNGKYMKNLNPDERSTSALLRIALQEEIFIFEKKVLPGITVHPGDLRTLLEKIAVNSFVVHLHEDGSDAFNTDTKEIISVSINENEEMVIVLSDNQDLSIEEADLIGGFSPLPLSLGPVSLQSHQAILVMHNLLDRLIA